MKLSFTRSGGFAGPATALKGEVTFEVTLGGHFRFRLSARSSTRGDSDSALDHHAASGGAASIPSAA